jgi:hypothetical protein
VRMYVKDCLRLGRAEHEHVVALVYGSKACKQSMRDLLGARSSGAGDSAVATGGIDCTRTVLVAEQAVAVLQDWLRVNRSPPCCSTVGECKSTSSS